ncbi:MAG: glycine zipper 2TM domain-containing protein [Xanthomonadaceae bacterium]|nr:glycine zipper 2TM domain-containing protein [Xanthomonadaceae bacterium]
MDKKLTLGIAIGVALASAGAVVASRGVFAPPEFVDVVRVGPEIAQVPVEREQCSDRKSTRVVPRDDNLNNGTLIGAVVGGALGNQVGGGSGRDAATVAGLVAGGYVGREMDRQHRKTRVVESTTRTCRVVTETVDQQIGWRVTYALDGVRRSVVMDRDPGEQVRLAEVQALPDATSRR